MSKEAKYFIAFVSLILTAIVLLTTFGCASRGDGAAVKLEVAKQREQMQQADLIAVNIQKESAVMHQILGYEAPKQADKIDKAADQQDGETQRWKTKYETLHGSTWNQIGRALNVLKWALIAAFIGVVAVGVFNPFGLGKLAVGALDILPVPNLARIICKLIGRKAAPVPNAGTVR